MQITAYKKRRVDRDQPVDVYRNLKIDGYSLRQGRRIVGHATALMLADAEFIVSDAGHRRSLMRGRRNVHAWVRGRIVESGMGTIPEEADRDKMPRVRYDRKNGRFTTDLTHPAQRVTSAMIVAFNRRGMFAAYMS